MNEETCTFAGYGSGFPKYVFGKRIHCKYAYPLQTRTIPPEFENFRNPAGICDFKLQECLSISNYEQVCTTFVYHPVSRYTSTDAAQLETTFPFLARLLATNQPQHPPTYQTPPSSTSQPRIRNVQ
eukprot:3348960-Rhodomonas_salina.1